MNVRTVRQMVVGAVCLLLVMTIGSYGVECTPQAGHVGAEIDTCHWADLISCSNSTGLT